MCICKKERQFSDMLSTDPNFISTFTSFTEKDLLQNFSFPSIFNAILHNAIFANVKRFSNTNSKRRRKIKLDQKCLAPKE